MSENRHHFMSAFPDVPKLLGNSDARHARLAQVGEPHVAALTDLVDALRREAGSGAHIPYFDPWDGGTEAELLFLLEAPGAKAVLSGFVSRNNPDETAKTFFALNQAAGIDRRRTVAWNIVPWYIGDGARIRAANGLDIESGLVALNRVIDLLPRLRVVILVGRKAERAYRLLADKRPNLKILRSPHPSPLFVNNKPGNRGRILEVLRQAAALLAAEG